MAGFRKDLELVDVTYESNGKKAVMTFLDVEDKAVRIVQFNKQVYDNGSFVDNEKKAAQVEEWSETYFGTSFDNLQSAVGSKHDVWVYEKFCSLWESAVVKKFTPDMEGQIYQAEIKEITVDDQAIHVRYDIDGDVYESKMSYAVYYEAMKAWFKDPIKEERQKTKFYDKFGVSADNASELVGRTLMIEVKKAMGKYLYGDMKAFPKGKK